MTHTRIKFKPTEKEFYKNTNDTIYQCLKSCDDNTAIFKSSGGWICTAHGIGIYSNGLIDWDYSTNGHFAKK